MSLAKLEGELLRVKESLGVVKEVNSEFEKVINEIGLLKQRSLASPETKRTITEELKSKEILDLFASVEKDFDDLKARMARQSLEREKIADFIESLRTRKTFTFDDTAKAIVFVEKAVDSLNSTHISIKPEFLGLVDLGEIAIQMSVHKSGGAIIIEKERFTEALALLLSRKMLRNIIFETDNAKIIFKASNNVLVESDNYNLKKIIRLSK